MKTRAFAVAAMGLCGLAVPASAQIIATSIPRAEAGGTGKGVTVSEKKWAIHLMGSPFAKWKISSYREEPKGDPTFQLAMTSDSASKFIGAAEVAFTASGNVTIGLGGWYNKLKTDDIEFFQFNVASPEQVGDGSVIIALSGLAPFERSVSELHGNVFFGDIGVQAGLVKTTRKQKGIRQGAQRLRVFPDGFAEFETLQSDQTFDQPSFSKTNWDAFAVYKKGSGSGSRYPWALSAGAGLYRDNEAKNTGFSGFLTLSLQFYKGLGIDTSLWYVNAKTQSAARDDLAAALDRALETNMSRFTIGIGYSFPN